MIAAPSGPALPVIGRQSPVVGHEVPDRQPTTGDWRPGAADIRPARVGDMRQVGLLINRFARQNLMLPKAHDQLARNFREFVVAVEPGGQVLGCGALRVYSEALAEIASLAVDESVQGRGVGRLLVERLLVEARALALSRVFALTLQEDFFHRLGFHTEPKESFPLKVWADCRNCPKLHACDEIAVAREI
ncbi:MAG TPA: N-acetyltransferase [Longimicrobiaceae bacterium]|nr:N-acetyltransferase [Longimicrobiaceae bacterium]